MPLHLFLVIFRKGVACQQQLYPTFERNTRPCTRKKLPPLCTHRKALRALGEYTFRWENGFRKASASCLLLRCQVVQLYPENCIIAFLATHLILCSVCKKPRSHDADLDQSFLATKKKSNYSPVLCVAPPPTETSHFDHGLITVRKLT